MSLLNRIFGDGLTDEQKSQVEEIFLTTYLPYFKKSLAEAKQVTDLKLKKNTLHLSLTWQFPAKDLHQQVTQELTAKLLQVSGIESVQITHKLDIKTYQTQPGVSPLNNIKNVIAVGSGKGGVGKSTTSTNLALALAEQGARVGILDADIYGPSTPTLLGLKGRPASNDNKIMQPMEAYGLQVMSIGFLIEEDTPMIWRGPVVTKTLLQLLAETDWKDLDYLVIDLPPGTGDIQLTLAQQIPVASAVIVSTPQDLALIDAKKAYRMFEKVNIPLAGIVENMSYHICSNCGHKEHIFGEAGAEKLAEEYKMDFLARLPLNMQIREDADSGKPSVIAQPTSEISQIYRELGYKITAKMAQGKRDYSTHFNAIEIR